MDMHNVGRNPAAILGGKRHIAYREQYEIYLVVYKSSRHFIFELNLKFLRDIR